MRTHCKECGKKLIGKNAMDVGYCIPCYHMMMADEVYDDEDDFQRCSSCDGHDACADFGCAIKSGLGHLVQRGEGI